MTTPTHTAPRIMVAFGSLLAYAIIFLVLFPSVGPSLAAFTMVPIVIIGWLLGVRGGLIFGLLCLPFNIVLFRIAGYSGSGSITPHISGGLVVILTGITIGWVSQLVGRVKRQAQELGEERKILQEEIERRKRAEERLTHDALHDPLTNLPNRRLFMSRLEHAIEWNKRHPEELFAVVYLDFDRFKIINDSLGHSVGDELLIGLARRLELSVRSMDTVARMGGDEFAILLEAAKNKQEFITIVKRLQKSLAAPFELQGNAIGITASIGIVTDLLRYEQFDDILRDADIAMYNAKVSGRNAVKIFDIMMREEAENVLKLESDLRKAIRNKEFRVHYQPLHSLKTQELTGFEALIRWEHPERGLLYPADFLQAAEESGLIVPIGQWVLHEACRQMKQWHVQFQVRPPLTISVNLSSRQFAQSDLVQQIEGVLEQTGLPAACLMLELTEMTLIEDIESAVIKIERLRKIGVKVEIDDFGTGYSSLGYLRQLPVDNLKIDRSFISTLGHSRSAIPIIRAIIAMANSMGMKVIAEGIETEEQLTSLLELECEFGQGFLFDKPIDSEAARALILEEAGVASQRRGQQRLLRTDKSVVLG